MPRVTEDSKRISLRVRPEQKAVLRRAAALRNTGTTDFVLRSALREAERVIEEAERITLSERDSLMVMKLLEKPPALNARLRKALASAEAKHAEQLPSFKNFRAIRRRLNGRVGSSRDMACFPSQ